MATAGYSGTPLPTKLGIKPGMAVVLADAPAGFAATLGELSSTASLVGLGTAPPPYDMLIAFYTDGARFRETFPEHASSVAADGALWVAWPKRASKVPTDITEDLLREVGLPTGMVDNKVCAIDETWSGLRFVVRKEYRATWPMLAG